ncbi:MAG: tRNA (5-methylaminomethyl-2-thiouridine)(34)-methyltransferase MnmD [Bacteroidetes bacterium]|nr:tRNA (5-methylaminomethyl-2-thiouridine)(34)-methyltransferase MnmD [Bacteroidota bacterium]
MRDLNQHYHSAFGAIQESQHIFIESGLMFALDKLPSLSANEIGKINVFEVGFGTGLNALLTQFEAEKQGVSINYSTIEASPLPESCWQALNYPHLFRSRVDSQIFAKLHLAPWNQTIEISPHFTLEKIHGTLEAFQAKTGEFDLVYFDAFSPDVQPELWTVEIFREIFQGLSTGGVMVTYSVKGDIVRALRSAGFSTVKLPGPPGKRHILRALKTIINTGA